MMPADPNTVSPPQPASPAPPAARPGVSPEDRQRLEGAFATYRRELPRLLAQGDAGRYALIQGDKVVSVWDTSRDAGQSGYERFGVEGGFAIQRINPLDVQRFALLDAGLVRDLRKEPPCPS